MSGLPPPPFSTGLPPPGLNSSLPPPPGGLSGLPPPPGGMGGLPPPPGGMGGLPPPPSGMGALASSIGGLGGLPPPPSSKGGLPPPPNSGFGKSNLNSGLGGLPPPPGGMSGLPPAPGGMSGLPPPPGMGAPLSTGAGLPPPPGIGSPLTTGVGLPPPPGGNMSGLPPPPGMGAPLSTGAGLPPPPSGSGFGSRIMTGLPPPPGGAFGSRGSISGLPPPPGGASGLPPPPGGMGGLPPPPGVSSPFNSRGSGFGSRGPMSGLPPPPGSSGLPPPPGSSGLPPPPGSMSGLPPPPGSSGLPPPPGSMSGLPPPPGSMGLPPPPSGGSGLPPPATFGTSAIASARGPSIQPSLASQRGGRTGDNQGPEGSLLRTCEICNTPCKERFVFACGGYYHPACLKCAQCKKQLVPPRCVNLRGKMVCIECARRPKDMKNCNVCNEPITDPKDVVEPPGISQYRCHKECFRCYECGCQLDLNRFEVVSDVPLCEKCKAVAMDRTCKECGEPIVGRFVLDRGRYFHVEHFVCCMCQRVLNGHSFVIHHNKYLCPEHGIIYLKTCGYCKAEITAIDPSRVRWGNKYYHKRCFVCRICGQHLELNKTRSCHGRPHCVDCFKKRVKAGEVNEEGHCANGNHMHTPEHTEELRSRFKKDAKNPEDWVEPMYASQQTVEKENEEKYNTKESKHHSNKGSKKSKHHSSGRGSKKSKHHSHR